MYRNLNEFERSYVNDKDLLRNEELSNPYGEDESCEYLSDEELLEKIKRVREYIASQPKLEDMEDIEEYINQKNAEAEQKLRDMRDREFGHRHK